MIEEDSICIGNSVQLLPSVTSGTPNFNYSWTVLDSSLSSYNILSPVASPIATANYNLTVTDIYSCQDSQSITVEVLDLPVVDVGPDQNKCFLDTALFNASISGAIPPYSFLWSPAGFLINDNLLNPSYISVLNKTFYLNVVDDFGCTNLDTISIDTITLPLISVPNDTILCNLPIGVNFSGFPSGGYWRGNGVNSSGLFTPYATGFFDIIYNYTDPSTGCDNEDTLQIEVVSPNLADAGSDISLCEDTNAVLLIGNPVSSTGFWSGNSIDSSGNYIVSNPGSFTFSYFHGEGNCLTSDQVTLTVNALPVVGAGNDVSYCVDAGLQTMVGSPSGGIWSGNGIMNGSSGIFDPDVAGAGIHTLVYSYVDGNSCENNDTVLVTVNGLPVVNAGNDINECNQPISVTLSGSPVGGTWSGSGITLGGVYTPNGVGTTSLVYSYTDPSTSCTNTDTLLAVVVAPPVIDAGNDVSVCEDTTSVTMVANQSGGTWSGNGIDATSGLYAVSNVGNYTFTYTYGTGTCLVTDQVTLTVNALPVVGAGNDVSYCVDAGLQTMVGSPSGGIWSGNGIMNGSSGIFDPDVAGAGIHTLVYSYVDGNSCENNDTVLVTVNGLPVVNAGNDINECNQPISVTLSGSPVGGTWSGSGITLGGVYTPNGVGTTSLVYNYTDPSTSCTNTDTLLAVVVAPPVIDAGNDVSVCEDTTSVTMVSNQSGGTWSGNGIDATSGLYAVSNVGNYTFTYTYGTGTCLVTDQVTLTVNALPVVGAGNDVSYCVDAGLQTMVGSPSGGIWSGNGIMNGSSGIFDPDVAGAGIHTLVYSYVDGNSCENNDTVLVTVNGLPVVNAGNDINECNQPISVTLSGSPVGGTWSGSGITLGGVYTPNGVGTTSLVYNYTDPSTSCTNTDTLLAVVVAPPVIDAGNDVSVCEDTTSVTMVSNQSGGTWSGNGIDATSGLYAVSNVGNYTFTYTYGTGTCLVTDQVTLTVNALPVVGAGNDVSYCVDAGLQTMVGSPSGGIWSGNGIMNGSSGIFDPDVAGAGIHTLVYSYVDGNSCENNDTVLVTVNGLPVVNAGNDINECNQPISVTLSGSPVGGTWSGSGITLGGVYTPNGVGTTSLVYNYTDPSTSCTNTDTLLAVVVAPPVIDAGNDVSVCEDTTSVTMVSNQSGGTWSGNGIDATSGLYAVSNVGNYTFTYTYGTGTCLVTDQVTLTVNALPVVGAGNDVSYCVDAGLQTMVGSPSGGIWSGNGIMNGSSGIFDPDVAGAGIHTLVYSYVDGNSCENNDTVLVTVNGLPVVNAGNDINECNQPISVTLSGSPVGGTWSGSGITLGGVYTPNGVGTTSLVYNYTDPSTSCTNTDTLLAVVVAPPVIDAGNDVSVCEDTTSVTMVSNQSGGTWSGNGIDATSGLYAVSNVGNYTFTYTYGTGTCLVTDQVTLTVNALPVVGAGNDVSYCVDAGLQTMVGSPSGGIWSGNGIMNGSSGIFDPDVAGAGIHTLVYSYVDGNSCENNDTVLVTVNGLPVVNAGNDINECNQPISVTLSGSPVGGTWSGSGITLGGVYTPNGVDTTSLVYSYTDPSTSCTNTDTLLAVVVAPPVIDAGNDVSVCEDTTSVTMVANQSGGTWSGNGIDATSGLYAVSNVGNYTFTYTYGTGTCLVTDQVTLTVNALPVVGAGNDVSYCVDAGLQTMVGSPSGGIWSGNGIMNGSSGIFDPDVAGAGIHTLVYSYVDGNSCENNDTVLVTVNGLPVVNAGLDTNICDQLIGVNYVGNPVGGYWTGSGMDSSG